MQTTDAPPLSADRESVRERLAEAPGVLCCLDFDGTLAPIVEDPDEATMPSALRERVADLAAAETVDVAAVSGRELVDLRERVDVSGVSYAGNHGLELRYEGDRSVHPEARESRDAVDRVCAELADRLAHVSGVEIENKGLTATVHVRRVPDDRVDEVFRAVENTVDRVGDGLAIHDGKAIREIRPDVDWDKGRAVERLVDEAPDGWLPLYVGDDVTDEDAFRVLDDEKGALDGIGVLVGDRETAADYRLESQRDVPAFLDLVADAQCE